METVAVSLGGLKYPVSLAHVGRSLSSPVHPRFRRYPATVEITGGWGPHTQPAREKASVVGIAGLQLRVGPWSASMTHESSPLFRLTRARQLLLMVTHLQGRELALRLSGRRHAVAEGHQPALFERWGAPGGGSSHFITQEVAR